jgi:hypothetical protein
MLAKHLYHRRTEALKIRTEAAQISTLSEYPSHVSNGEEQDYSNTGGLSYIANYSKGLPHNAFGEVNRRAYRAMVRALHSRDPQLFEQIPKGFVLGRNLTNPQAGLAFDLEGPDGHAMAIPPAPRIDGPENSGEMGELYWMALLRDVSFIDYGSGAGTDAGANNTGAAATSLTNEFSVFRGPRDAAGNVTPATLFRGIALGDEVGPYVSQFLLRGNVDPILGPTAADGFIKYGTLRIDQRQKTAQTGVDFLTTFPQWLAVQNGLNTIGTDVFDPNRLFIRNLRDLATYVHFDALYEAYLNACIILLEMRASFDPGNPYIDSRNQDGFGTFGGPHILSLVTEVATRALKAVWFQKWLVHRRLRPEAFGGLIHVHRNVNPGRYPMIDPEILNSSVIPLVEGLPNGTALLPMAFPEGSPMHPAYGAGHATVAGACVTILKAWFDESFVLPNPVQSNAAGTNLIPFAGPPLTVGGELNKLAANIAIGRNAAGVHWRTDYTESIRLGERLAIGLLEEQKLLYNESSNLSLTKFDGTAVTI